MTDRHTTLVPADTHSPPAAAFIGGVRNLPLPDWLSGAAASAEGNAS